MERCLVSAMALSERLGSFIMGGQAIKIIAILSDDSSQIFDCLVRGRRYRDLE